MNRILFGLLIPALLVVTAGSVHAQAGGFAYIDTERILAEAPGTREAQTAFEQDITRFRAELERLEMQLDSLQESFERQSGTLSASARDQRQQELQQRFAQYQQRRAELDESAQRRQAELIGPIMQRINQALDDIRREGNYAMIFDTASGAVAVADPSLDLTTRVLDRLRQTASR